jgi:hypothetical protein
MDCGTKLAGSAGEAVEEDEIGCGRDDGPGAGWMVCETDMVLVEFCGAVGLFGWILVKGGRCLWWICI